MTVRVTWDENGSGQRVSCRDLVEAGSFIFDLVARGKDTDISEIQVDGTPLDAMPQGWWKTAVDEANRR